MRLWGGIILYSKKLWLQKLWQIGTQNKEKIGKLSISIKKIKRLADKTYQQLPISLVFYCQSILPHTVLRNSYKRKHSHLDFQYFLSNDHTSHIMYSLIY